MPNIFYSKIKHFNGRNELDIDPTSTLQYFLNKCNVGDIIQITLKAKKPTRSDLQNNSIHLYLEWVARELINKGLTIQNVVAKIRKAEITPTKDNLKEVMWKPMQKVVVGKKSTTELNKLEVNEVYEPLSMWLAKEFQIDLPFPSDEDKAYTNLMSMQGIRDKFIKK